MLCPAAAPESGYATHKAEEVDCNDNDPQHWSGTYPACDSDCEDADGDGRGKNCDLNTDCDESDPTRYNGLALYADADGDGFGKGEAVCENCEPCPEGLSHVPNNEDCNDDELECGSRCYPNSEEQDVCDGWDNDCDGETDENADWVWYYDEDLDGYTVNEGSQQSCDDPDGTGGENHWLRTPTQSDCAPEMSNCNIDCKDRDRDGKMDCNDDGCIDKDRDGYGEGLACDGPDCDDDDASCSIGCETYYKDVDGDGYVVLESKRTSCVDPDKETPGNQNEWVIPVGTPEPDCNDFDSSHWS
jgi:hypothetical protein